LTNGLKETNRPPAEKTTFAFSLMPSAYIEASDAEINKDREGFYFKMETTKLDYFKNRLMEERARLEDELSNTGKFNLENSLSGSVQELSAYDNHPGDLGSETFERQKDLALWNNTREIRQRVDEALDHLDKGLYGICEDCGREIPEERLEAIPYTTLCVACQFNEEDHHQSRERPVEEEVLGPPFGRTFLDDTDNIEFDGEDTWQAVAKYGTSESPSDLGGVDSYNDTYLNADEEQGIVEKMDNIRDS
jgi:YteA family regulatory protein